VQATVFRGQLKRQPITVRPETMLTKSKKKSIQDLDGSFVTIVRCGLLLTWYSNFNNILMITSANIKTHSGIININNTLIQRSGWRGGVYSCCCCCYCWMLQLRQCYQNNQRRGRVAVARMERQERPEKQCNRGLWPLAWNK